MQIHVMNLTPISLVTDQYHLKTFIPAEKKTRPTVVRIPAVGRISNKPKPSRKILLTLSASMVSGSSLIIGIKKSGKLW